MTPADLGLPEAPWYGARFYGTEEWTVVGGLKEALDELCSESDSHPSFLYSQRLEVVAFRCARRNEKLEDGIIAGPVKVIVEVTVRKMEP